MARLVVCDTQGLLMADIEAAGAYLEEALEHDLAEAVIRCAVLMAISSLIEGGEWPGKVLDSMAEFMGRMREELCRRKIH